MEEETDYHDLIQAKVEEAVLNGYKAKPEFEQDVEDTLTALGVTYERLNTYLNKAQAAGINPEAALECYVLTLSI